MKRTEIPFTWKEFDRAVDKIAHDLQKLGIVSKVNTIYGIPKGGLVLAVALCHRLNKPLVTNIPPADSLIVDEICDTGMTLKSLVNLYHNRYTATIHYVTTSSFRPNVYACLRGKDDWIIYPWERK